MCVVVVVLVVLVFVLVLFIFFFPLLPPLLLVDVSKRRVESRDVAKIP
jgi:hypothetical protein